MTSAAASSAAATKTELRERFGTARRAMDEATRTSARQAVCSVVLERCRAAGWACVAAYVPLRTEPGSLELLDELASLHVRVLVPVTLPDRDLDWTVWGSTTPLGDMAVSGADAVLAPALAVASSDGTRLGRGGGSYDRALARCSPDVPIAALLYENEVVSHLPREPWDLPVTDIVTPTGWRPVPGNTRVADQS